MFKGGFHINAWSGLVRQRIREAKPRALKVLQLDKAALIEYKSLVPNGFVVYRHYYAQQPLDDPVTDANSVADTLLNDLVGYEGLVDAVEAYNETGLNEQSDAYSVFTFQICTRLHPKFKVVAYCFSEEQPSLDQWPHYFHGLTLADYLGLHEYSAPTMMDKAGDRCFRYRKVWALLPDNCKKPILITECGIDGGVLGTPNAGYQVYGDDDHFISSLQWYSDGTNQDSYLLYWFIYCIGSVDPTWKTFDIVNSQKIIDWIGKNSMTAPVRNVTGINAWVWYAPDMSDAKTKVSSLIVKYSDGPDHGDSSNPNVFRDQFTHWCPKLKTMGLQVNAYAYLYLLDPVNEAKAIAQAILQDGADGLVLDAEYEAVGRINQAATFFTTLWSLIPRSTYVAFSPDLRILTGNKFPFNMAPDFTTEPWAWNTFVANCQAILPQLYWTDFQQSPATTFGLIDTFTRAFPGNTLQVIPILPADTTLADLTTAVGLCKARGYTAVSIWRYDDFTNWDELRRLFMQLTSDTYLGVLKVIFGPTGIAFNPTAALNQAYLQAWKDGHYLGIPIGGEFDVGGYRFQQYQYDVVWAEINNWGNHGYGYKV